MRAGRPPLLCSFERPSCSRFRFEQPAPHVEERPTDEYGSPEQDERLLGERVGRTVASLSMPRRWRRQRAGGVAWVTASRHPRDDHWPARCGAPRTRLERHLQAVWERAERGALAGDRRGPWPDASRPAL